jgi:hypothetical protein
MPNQTARPSDASVSRVASHQRTVNTMILYGKHGIKYRPRMRITSFVGGLTKGRKVGPMTLRELLAEKTGATLRLHLATDAIALPPILSLITEATFEGYEPAIVQPQIQTENPDGWGLLTFAARFRYIGAFPAVTIANAYLTAEINGTKFLLYVFAMTEEDTKTIPKGEVNWQIDNCAFMLD